MIKLKVQVELEVPDADWEEFREHQVAEWGEPCDNLALASFVASDLESTAGCQFADAFVTSDVIELTQE